MNEINEKNGKDGRGIWIPKRAVFETTLACDMRCRHCGSRAGTPRPDELSTAECARVFEELAALGNEWLTISGGEPMARPDWLDLIRAAASAGLRAGMITNALRFDAAAAKAAKAAGLVAVGFSVDGVGPTHDRIRGRLGHYGRVVDAMADARSAELPFTVVTHINATNIGELDGIHDLVLENGVYAWQVQLGTEMGNFADHAELQLRPRDLPAIEAKLGRLIARSPLRIYVADSIGYFGPNERLLRHGSCFGGCGAGIRVVGIESNGNIKGCLSIMAGYNERGAEFVEGNVREESFADIWYREGAFAYTRKRSVEDLLGTCRECPQAARCHGGCTSKKVASGGGAENPMCVLRVLTERKLARKRATGQAAAAAVFASFLGFGAEACNSDTNNNIVPYGIVDIDGGTDTDTDSDTDAGTDTDTDSNGGTDTDTDSDTDAGTDTDSELDGGIIPIYDMPAIRGD